MTTHNKPPRADTAAGSRDFICYGCGKKFHTAEEIVENEQAVYCETCYRDKYFYHTTNGGKGLERNRC